MKRQRVPTSPPADPATHDRAAVDRPTAQPPNPPAVDGVQSADAAASCGEGPAPGHAARNGDAADRQTNGDVLAAAGIRPWCRGLMIILAHGHHLTLMNIIDAVTAAANSGGLTPVEAALLAEVRGGAIARDAQNVQRIAP